MLRRPPAGTSCGCGRSASTSCGQRRRGRSSSSWLSSRQRSILGMISCSSRIACSTRASVEKPVLPRRLRDRPSFSNRICAELLGRAEDELLAREVPDLALERRRSPRRTRSLISRQALDVEPHARALHVAQDARRAAARCRPCSALRARARRAARAASRRARRSSTASRRRDPRRPVGEPALLAAARGTGSRAAPARAGRRRAACRGRALGGTVAERLGVVGDDGPVAERRDERPRRSRTTRRRAPPSSRRRRRSAWASSWANSSPSGHLGQRARRRRDLGAGQRAARRRACAVAHLGSPTVALGRRRRRRLVGVAERLLQAPQRVAQLELAEDLAQPRAVGLLRGDLGRGRLDRRRRAGSSPARLDSARGVGVLGEVLLALGAGDLVDRARAPPRGRRSCWSSVAGGLVADARDAGDVVRRVALEAVEVGDELGRDAVAVDAPPGGRRAWCR